MFFNSDYIHFEPKDNSIPIITNKSVLPIVVLEEEHESVKRVAKDLQTDLKKVTGKDTKIHNKMIDKPAIIIGTVKNKEIIDQLAIDSNELKDKWETFTIQPIKFPGQKLPSVSILGSDNRGAIYGVYDLIEKIGVSPWYWWMDVPIKKHKEIYISNEKITKGEPSVKYRGFFLNDEGPSLMSWVRTHFPDFTHEFYAKIFELTLRLKANYHWPAMWDSSFYEDDELNIKTADLYGVVIGTSHHEPMDRPHGDWKKHKKGPWDYVENENYLKEFWKQGIKRSKPYETIINIGMRGDGDEPMGGDSTFEEKVELMKKIIKDQRTIIQDVMEVPIDRVPQMWALYKEVKDYYDSGMDIPEDVILLWGDDNFGNIRRLPTKEEQKRKGGAGIYYHFDYVGGPRSYKWINTVPIQKTYEQMHKAYEHKADKVWIVNVGDLKPMEYQTEFFLRLAWDIDAFNPNNLEKYAEEWASYNFVEEYGKDIAKIIRDYVKFNGRIKPEVINLVKLYSWENEFEAERMLKELDKTVEKAKKIMKNLPDNYKDSFYQVAYYPAKASYVVLKLQLLANLSDIYKKEGRVATNDVAREVERLFELDKRLTFEYNKRISNGKWDHMMDQLHIGYTYWQQPDELIMPEVSRIKNTELNDGKWDYKVLNTNQTDVYSKKPIVLEIYNKGLKSIPIEVAAAQDWVKLSFEKTELVSQTRLLIEIDWNKIEYGDEIETFITITDNQNNQKKTKLLIHNPEKLVEGGYVAVDGKIAIEAEDYSHKRESNGQKWRIFPDYGRTKSSMALYPVNIEKEYDLDSTPRLSYDFILNEDIETIFNIIIAPSLNMNPTRDVSLGLSIDDGPVEIISAGDLSQDGSRDSKEWEESVIYNAHILKSSKRSLKAGKHTVHLLIVDPQIAIQKLIIDLGGMEQTFLGPEPTPHADKLSDYRAYQPVKQTDYLSVPGERKLNKKIDKLNLYINKAGFYQFRNKKEVIVPEKINGKKGISLKENTVFLEEGMLTVKFEQPISFIKIDLIKYLPFVLTPVIKTDKTNTRDELVLQVLMHNTGENSNFYRLDVQAVGNEKILEGAATKGILKADEQKIHSFVFDLDAVENIQNIKLTLLVDGWENKLLLPFSL